MKKLLQELKSQVSCSICFELLRVPKILPCLHAFCLQCLNKMAGHHADEGEFECPTCRATVLIPQPERTFDSCTSSFLHNRLLDLLAIKEARSTPALCGNCCKNASDCSYCFDCRNMFCGVCLNSHNALRNHAEHKVKTLEHFGPEDYERYLQMPSFCTVKFHESQPLLFYCRECELCMCQLCGITNQKIHSTHNIVDLEEAAEQRKKNLLADIEKLVQIQAKCKRNTSKLERQSCELNTNVESVKKIVSEFADKLVRSVRTNEQDLLTHLETLRASRQDDLKQKKTALSSQSNQIRGAVNYAKALIESRATAELMSKRNTDDHLKVLVNGGRDLDKPTTMSTEVQFHRAGRLELTGSEIEKIGHVVTVHFTAQSGTANRNVIRYEAYKESRSYNSLKSAELTMVSLWELKGARGSGIVSPRGIAISKEGEVVVSDESNNCILIYNTNGEYQRTLGHKGIKPGEFNKPHGIAFTSARDIVVVDSENNRIQVLNKESGVPMVCFGSSGKDSGQFCVPEGVSVDGTDRILVADFGNHRVQAFTSTGVFLFQFGCEGPQKLYCPRHCITMNDKFVVSDTYNNCIKVFDANGKFKYRIGRQGFEICEFYRPCGIAVDSEDNLLICDMDNNRLQLLTLEGRFIAHSSCNFRSPLNAALMQDGKIAVTTADGILRLSIFQLTKLKHEDEL